MSLSNVNTTNTEEQQMETTVGKAREAVSSPDLLPRLSQ
jgi:hypothetical protein